MSPTSTSLYLDLSELELSFLPNESVKTTPVFPVTESKASDPFLDRIVFSENISLNLRCFQSNIYLVIYDSRKCYFTSHL